MKISIWSIGKTNESYLVSGITKYLDRLKHYTKLEYDEFKDVKPGQQAEETTKRESEVFLSKIKPDDVVILLDEKGKEYDSIGFAKFIEQHTIHSAKNLVFIIGGAFGHHDQLRHRANHSLSLSKMTFSHQMVRLFFVEQIYRAFTIIKNEKYHNS